MLNISTIKEIVKNIKVRMVVIFFLVVIVIGIAVGVLRSSMSADTGGAISIPNPPTIQSIPGETKLSPQYVNTLMKANQDVVQKALSTGGSAIPTIVNLDQNNFNPNTSQQSCSSLQETLQSCGFTLNKRALGVNDLLKQMVVQGNLSPIVAAELSQMADKNVSVSDYEGKLNQLVREGRLTPEQAAKLLSSYRAQHPAAGAGVQAKTGPNELIDQLVSSGDLSPDVAKELKQLTDSNASASDYESSLNQLVAQGKLTPEQAKQLLDAYRSTHASGTGGVVNDLISSLAASGQLTPETAETLKQLSSSGLSSSDYAAKLDQLVAQGKLTPEQASRLLSAYQQQQGLKPTETASELVDKMLKSGQLSPEVAASLKALSGSKASIGDYASALDNLVKQGKLTPEQAKQLLSAYRAEQGLSKEPYASNLADKMLAAGGISPATAAAIKDLGNQSLSARDYAAKLQQMVANGQLTPEQARQFLAAYRREQGVGGSASPVGNMVDQMLATGALSSEAASALKGLADQNVSPGVYADKLREMVRNGSLTPDQALRLLNAYRVQHGLPPIQSANSRVDQMLQSGELDAKTAAQLKQLADRGVTVGDYETNLKRMVKEGKLTPEQARQLLTAYRAEHGLGGTAAASNLASEMVENGQISAETGRKLQKLSGQGLSVGDYAAHLSDLVRRGELTPQQARMLLTAYRKEHGVGPVTNADKLVDQLLAKGSISEQIAKQLHDLSSAGVPAADYAAALNRLVDSGQLSPDEAKALLMAYRQQHGDTGVVMGTGATADVIRSQQEAALRAQESELNRELDAMPSKQFAANGDAARAELAALQSAIQGQAQSLLNAWAPVSQTYISAPPPKTDVEAAAKAGEKAAGEKGSAEGDSSDKKAIPTPFIKAGSIMFAVLDTEANTDRPGPIMATMVSGRLRGAKLMGGLSPTSDGERVTLKFTTMTKGKWPANVTINAVAINPDTASTALASSVDHHYLVRWGSLFAANFISGYAKAVSQSGSTIMNNTGTTTTSKGNYSPTDKMLMGFGKVGDKLSQVAGKWVDKPPTVSVQAGVGLGILFLDDVPSDLIPAYEMKNQGAGAQESGIRSQESGVSDQELGS